MSNFLEQHLPAIITGLLGFGAWIFEKRKKNAEIQKVESDAIAAMQEAYKTFVGDLNRNYEALKFKVEILEQDVIEWKLKYETLRREMDKIDH